MSVTTGRERKRIAFSRMCGQRAVGDNNDSNCRDTVEFIMVNVASLRSVFRPVQLLYCFDRLQPLLSVGEALMAIWRECGNVNCLWECVAVPVFLG